MSGKVVLDSGVIAALFFKEEVSDRVQEIVDGYSEYHTLSIAYPEVASVAWKKVKIYGEDEEVSKQALESAAEFIDSICEVADGKSILARAFELAVEHDITVYDALFIALAIQLKARLITTDRELYKKLKGTELEGFVECIG